MYKKLGLIVLYKSKHDRYTLLIERSSIFWRKLAMTVEIEVL